MELKVDLDVERLGKEIAKALMVELAPIFQGTKREQTVFTKKELSQYLGVSGSWINARITTKEIPYIKMGRHVRFAKDEVDKWRFSGSIPQINTRQPILKNIKFK
jgi:excisionase family DNA binding protein